MLACVCVLPPTTTTATLSHLCDACVCAHRRPSAPCLALPFHVLLHLVRVACVISCLCLLSPIFATNDKKNAPPPPGVAFQRFVPLCGGLVRRVNARLSAISCARGPCLSLWSREFGRCGERRAALCACADRRRRVTGAGRRRRAKHKGTPAKGCPRHSIKHNTNHVLH